MVFHVSSLLPVAVQKPYHTQVVFDAAHQHSSLTARAHTHWIIHNEMYTSNCQQRPTTTFPYMQNSFWNSSQYLTSFCMIFSSELKVHKWIFPFWWMIRQYPQPNGMISMMTMIVAEGVSATSVSESVRIGTETGWVNTDKYACYKIAALWHPYIFLNRIKLIPNSICDGTDIQRMACFSMLCCEKVSCLRGDRVPEWMVFQMRWWDFWDDWREI